MCNFQASEIKYIHAESPRGITPEATYISMASYLGTAVMLSLFVGLYGTLHVQTV
jgi:hypothetical protein